MSAAIEHRYDLVVDNIINGNLHDAYGLITSSDDPLVTVMDVLFALSETEKTMQSAAHRLRKLLILGAEWNA